MNSTYTLQDMCKKYITKQFKNNTEYFAALSQRWFSQLSGFRKILWWPQLLRFLFMLLFFCLCYSLDLWFLQIYDEHQQRKCLVHAFTCALCFYTCNCRGVDAGLAGKGSHQNNWLPTAMKCLLNSTQV